MPRRRVPRCLLVAVLGGLVAWMLPAFGGPGGTGALDLSPEEIVARQERGVCAIVMVSTGRRSATGVLAGERLVLTNRHVVDLYPGSLQCWNADAFAVRFEGRDGEPDRSFPVVAYAHLSDRHDLCVLRIGPDAQGRLPERSRVQSFSRQRVLLDAPIYVIHHPRGGPLQVTTGGRVWFPFAATPDELRRIEMRLSFDGGLAAEVSARLDACRESYRRGPDGLLHNYSRRWAGQPVIGADCLTFHGSSGAPIYDAQTHALVGVLFAGVDETRKDYASRWDHHEAILPADAILDELARSADPAVRAVATGAR